MSDKTTDIIDKAYDMVEAFGAGEREKVVELKNDLFDLLKEHDPARFDDRFGEGASRFQDNYADPV